MENIEFNYVFKHFKTGSVIKRTYDFMQIFNGDARKSVLGLNEQGYVLIERTLGEYTPKVVKFTRKISRVGNNKQLVIYIPVAVAKLVRFEKEYKITLEELPEDTLVPTET